MGKACLKLVIDRSARKGLEQFCKFLLIRHGLGHNTINNYRKMVGRFLETVGDQEPTAALVEDYIAEMYLAERYSYFHITGTIRSLERYMEFNGHPLRLARPRKPRFAQKEALSEAEIAVILSVVKRTRERAMIGLLAYAGIRNEELCALKTDHVDLANNTVFVSQGKGSKDRTVPITGDCSKLVMQYLSAFPRGDNEYLFTTLRAGESYTSWALRRLIKKVALKAGIKKKISPHTFRHSLATNLSARGADIQTIQAILGHSSIQTTMMYISTSPKRVQANYMRYAPSYT